MLDRHIVLMYNLLRYKFRNVLRVEDMDKMSYIKLLDIYGKLLTENQQEIMVLYYGYDLSLSEIAEEKHVSRQSVSECITKSRRQLEEFEDKLGFDKTIASLNERYEKLVKFIEDKESEKGGYSEILDYIKREC